MCLVLFSYRQHPQYPLILLANRDEFYERPTAPMHDWSDHPGLLAGRDLRSGGTWMGLTHSGRYAVVTNFRDPQPLQPDAPSRGVLVANYLWGSESPAAFVARQARRADRYNGFNLLVGDQEALWYLSNRAPAPRPVAPGLYGLSNALLDVPWPKVQRGKARLAEAMAREVFDPDQLLDLLHDETIAPDEDLPDTGVGTAWERLLSPLFIRTPTYGTRSSTVLLIDHEGRALLAERTYSPQGEPPLTRHYTLQLDRMPTADQPRG